MPTPLWRRLLWVCNTLFNVPGLQISQFFFKTSGHLSAATQRQDHQQFLEEILAKAKKEDEIAEGVAEIIAQSKRKPSPIALNVFDPLKATNTVRELRDARVAIAALRSSGSSFIVSLCEEPATAIDSLIEVLEGVLDVTSRVGIFQSILQVQTVRDILSQEVDLLEGAEQEMHAVFEILSSVAVLWTLFEGPFEEMRRRVKCAVLKANEAEKMLRAAINAAKAQCPRLHSLPDNTVLQIFTAKTERSAVRTYLPMLYSAVVDIICDDDEDIVNLTITGVLTAAGDQLCFDQALVIPGGTPLAEWVGVHLDAKIEQTINKLIQQAGRQNEAMRHSKDGLSLEYLEKLPGQTCLLGVYMLWTSLVEGTLGVPKNPPPPFRRTSGTKTDNNEAWAQPGLSSVADSACGRPQSAGGSQVFTNRPLSANVRRTAKRPATAEHRLRQLTTPLAQDSAMVCRGFFILF